MTFALLRRSLLLASLGLLPPALQAQKPPQPPLVYGAKIEPCWFAENTAFWYRLGLPGGGRAFVVVDAAAGKRTSAFDHGRLATAFTALLGREVLPEKLPVDALEFASDRRSVILRGGLQRWRLDLETYALVADTPEAKPTSLPFDRTIRPSRQGGAPSEIRFVNLLDGDVELFWIDPDGDLRGHGKLPKGEEVLKASFVGHTWAVKQNRTLVAVFETPAKPGTAIVDGRQPDRASPPPVPPVVTAPSPDGKREAFVRDHNLWLRELPAGRETQLSFDGNPGHTFHKDATRGRLIDMDYERPDEPATLPEVFWSPDSSRLVALQTRVVPDRKVIMIESSPKDQLQPKLHSYPYLKPGDEIPVATPRLFIAATGKETKVATTLFPQPWSLDSWHWTPDSKTFCFLYNQRGHQLMRVLAVDAASGAVRTVVEEASATLVDYSNKTTLEWLDATGELVWASERSGWNHLYLVDLASGRMRPITQGPWVMRSLERLDAEKRQVHFRAGGLISGQDPYYWQHCRVNLDGTGFKMLTEGDGTHTVQWSPDKRFLLDTWSRVDLPPVTVLRKAADGTLVCGLEEADAREVLARRGRYPERFVAKGRDGVTDIYGIIHWPKQVEPGKLIPVIECIYAGPNDQHVPKQFRAAWNYQDSLLARGFAVVQIDGMGTNWRSRAFHDVCWKNLADAGFPDRIAWIRAAAKLHPELDVEHVGIYGGSAGGQNTVTALLRFGDFYKAGVADCGCHDNRMDKIWWNEQWLGWPVGPHYAEQSNVTLAPNLKGHLMLVVGELDRNVDPASTLQVANALIKADKDFDLLVMTGAGHGSAESPYGVRRRADFFVRHLMGK